jgi:hypothetical protein
LFTGFNFSQQFSEQFSEHLTCQNQIDCGKITTDVGSLKTDSSCTSTDKGCIPNTYCRFSGGGGGGGGGSCSNDGDKKNNPCCLGTSEFVNNWDGTDSYSKCCTPSTPITPTSGCTLDKDCGVNQKCVSGTCQNNTPTGTCTVDTDCSGNGNCISGNCVCTGGYTGDHCQTAPSTPTGGGDSKGCFKGHSDYGIPLSNQKDIASKFWTYKWGPNQGVGVIQIVNGGSDTMWIRYGGEGISSPTDTYYWKSYITTNSALNGNNAHSWNAVFTNGMEGQGDGFKLNPGEYQILPYVGTACWFAGSLGCDKNGSNCIINPQGRGAQPNLLFEWTVNSAGVWDASMVDGFQLPMKVEVDGSPPDIDPIMYFQSDPDLCPNKLYDSKKNYIGCMSMCYCQGSPPYSVNSSCPNMLSINEMPNYIDPDKKVDDNINAAGKEKGYCGCIPTGCSPWLNNLFKNDPAGKNYCDSVTKTTANKNGQRTVYCNAYDDSAGTRSSGNGIIKPNNAPGLYLNPM